jgi:three-Cys-motif partner protein
MSPNRPARLQIDSIGYWSEIKLDIIREYAKAYSTILSAQQKPALSHAYIDAFAGAGVHESRTTGEEVDGSPRIAVATDPPFRDYYLIDLNGARVDHLRAMFSANPAVHVFEGDCNQVMLNEVLPNVRWNQYRRGLCLLDPYGLHLNWNVIETCGQSGAIDLFLNFPIADMNRNVFWRNSEGVDPADIARMNAFWGDDSWRRVAYKAVPTLFGDIEEKTDNETIAEAFRERLRLVAGFANVPDPLPMRNTTGAVVYYLYFASKKPVAAKIVQDIFTKYRNRGAV